MALIDNRVSTFIEVVEHGSFSSAAKALYLSPVSVMKQIESLESELGVRLLDRSPRGAVPNRAGEAFLQDAERMRDLADAVAARMSVMRAPKEGVVRVGTSLLRPCRPLMDLIARRGAELPCRIEVVPFSDDPASLRRTIESLGNAIDCFVGPVGSREFVERHGVLVLGAWECRVAVSRSHPLAAKERLTWADLNGEQLMLVRRGDSFVLDRMRDEIARLHPGIEVVDAPHYYDAEIFNECERQGVVMETLEAWADIHPGVATIPVDWGYQMPYGIVYAKEPSPVVQGFIDAIVDGLKKHGTAH